jgi:hypothetical protein
MMVVKHLTGLTAKEVPVYYIPGNHDEMLRRFRGFQLGSLKITNKLSLKVDGAPRYCRPPYREACTTPYAWPCTRPWCSYLAAACNVVILPCNLSPANY